MRKCRVLSAIFLVALPLVPVTAALESAETKPIAAASSQDLARPEIPRASRSENIVVTPTTAAHVIAPTSTSTSVTTLKVTNATTTTGGATNNVTTGSLPEPVSGSVTDIVRAQVGKRYVYGATGPNAFDCSGLVYYAFNQAGIAIPRLTAQGYYARYPHVDKNNLQPGDLVVSSGHVGIYVGGGQMVHASTPRGGVKLAGIGSPRPIGFVRIN